MQGTDLILTSNMETVLSKGRLNEISTKSKEDILAMSSLLNDFSVVSRDGSVKLERKDSNLYESSSSLAVIAILQDGSLSLDYIGDEGATVSSFDESSIKDAYDLITIVDSALQVQEDCARVFILYNFKEFFETNGLKDKLAKYVEEKGIYVAI